MKKILSLMLALVLVFSLVACGTTNQETISETKTETTAETKTETSVETTSETQAEEKTSNGLTGKVNIYTRDSSSGTRGAFEELVGFKDKLASSAAEVSSNGDMATKVGQDANGIGYVSLTTDFEANNIKPLAYEGVAPSEEAVLDGSYKLKRPFSFVTRAAGNFVSEDTEQLVEAFIVFMTQSTEGLEAVASAGGIVDINSGKPWEELKAQFPAVDKDNSGITIRTGGSTSVEKALKAAIEAFQPLAGGVQFVSSHTGSGDGFKNTLGSEKDSANAVDIGFASREFKAEETVKDGKLTGVFAQDAVVVVVNASNPTEDLTNDKLFNIFTGASANWEDVK